jgi:hypothetical protein
MKHGGICGVKSDLHVHDQRTPCHHDYAPSSSPAPLLETVKLSVVSIAQANLSTMPGKVLG